MKKKRPSQTALKVGLNIIALGNVPGMKNVLPEGIIEATIKLLSDGKITSEKRIRKHQSPKIVSLYKKFDWIIPGQFEAFAYRKAFCEKSVIKAIGNGATQVLVLGAGYDTLCLRLAPKYPGVKFFEIDSPPTAKRKINGLEKIGRTENHIVIPEDLGENDLENVLNKRGDWDTKSKSVILAEGLLQYLRPEDVKELFNQCDRLTGKESMIAFTYISKGKDSRPYAGPRSGLMLWLLKVTGEPWLWSVTEDELNNLLNETGWNYSSDLNLQQKSNGVEFYANADKEQ